MRKSLTEQIGINDELNRSIKMTNLKEIEVN